MATCPRCQSPLVLRKTAKGVVFGCPGCGGRAVAFPVLRRLGAAPAFLATLWKQGRWGHAPRVLPCPHCGRKMARVKVEGPGGGKVALDLCPRCHSLWFDRRELEAVPKAPPGAPATEPLSREARQRLAVFKVTERSSVSQAGGAEADLVPTEWWHWIPGMLGLPVETEAPMRTIRPWVTWSVAGLFLVVFLATMGRLEEVVEAWGFMATEPGRHGGLTVITSFFLHAGWFHLLANTYFFLVFGDNVEEDLGRWPAVLLLLGAHGTGLLLHGWLTGDPTRVTIGASAGISGVMAYYAIAFPWARVSVLLRIGYLPFPWLRFPAFVFLLFYMAFQALGSLLQMSGWGGVNYLAHLGGLGTGIAVALGVRMVRRRRAVRAMAT